MTGKSLFRLPIILGFFILLAVMYTGQRLYNLGVLVKIQDQSELEQTVLGGFPGPEALQMDRDTGMLFFISSDPCRSFKNSGRICFLDLQDDQSKPGCFPGNYPQDFHPHGLSFLREHNGARLLFTNNHRSDGSHTVEIFRIAEHRLEHLETIDGPALTSPNDLVAVGKRQFFVTIDGRAHDRATRAIDTFLGRETGSVLFYNGASFEQIVDNLLFPNGITYDRSTSSLIVGETTSGRMVIYQLDENNHILNVDNFFIRPGVDNISLNAPGEIIVATHPNLIALSRHMRNVDKPSASQVFSLRYLTKDLKLIYEHDGSVISGVSAAIKYHNDLYLGAVCDNKLVRVSIDN